MPPLKHALIGGSNLKQAMACPPSVMMQQRYPEQESEAAAEGTLAHEIAEEHLRQLIDGYKVETGSYHKTNPLYKPSMEEFVDVYTDYVWSIYEEAKQHTPDALLLIEDRVDFSNYVPGGYGTSDAVIVADNTLHIIDLKYGKGVPVFADGNPQLRIYALGEINSLGLIYDIRQVKMHIVQPRLDSITSDTMTVEELVHWGKTEVLPKVTLAINGEGETKAGDHCKFCRCKVTCRAYNAMMLEIGDIKGDDRSPQELSDAEIAKVLERSSEIASWARTVKQWAQDQAISGRKTFPGWKVVEGRSVRTIADETEAIKVLQEKGYGPEKTTKLIGLTDLEELVGRKYLSEILNDLIVKPAGKPTLAPEKDKRPVWTGSAENVFSIID